MRIIVETRSRVRARLRTRIRRRVLRALNRLAGVPIAEEDGCVSFQRVSRFGTVVRSVASHPLIGNPETRAMTLVMLVGALHVAFAVVSIVTGLFARSIWTVSVGLLIAALNTCKSYLASGALMSVAVEDRFETIDSLRRCRRVGVALALAVMAMSSTVARLVLQGSGAAYPGALIYGYAGYAFVMIVIAIVNLARARRIETLAVKGVRALNLAGALTSIFALQTVLLSRVAWERLPEGVSRDVVEGSLGGLVCLCLLIMGLWLALSATGRLVERRGDELRFSVDRRPAGKQGRDASLSSRGR